LLLLLSRAIEPLHQALVVQNVLAAWYLANRGSVCESIHTDHTFGRAELVYFFVIFAIIHLGDHLLVVRNQVSVGLSAGIFLLSSTLSFSDMLRPDYSALTEGFLLVHISVVSVVQRYPVIIYRCHLLSVSLEPEYDGAARQTHAEAEQHEHQRRDLSEECFSSSDGLRLLDVEHEGVVG